MVRQLTSTYAFYLFAAIISTGLLNGTAQGASNCSRCPAVYDPVCGIRSRTTYPNSCIANCTLQGKDTWTSGSCEYNNPFDTCYPAVKCSDDPCLVTSKDYPDAMVSKCLSVWYIGAHDWNQGFQEIPVCSAIWVPPIGNAFVRTTDLKYNCLCPSNVTPVCGTNRHTYSNECMAKCNRVQVAYYRECSNSSRSDCICTQQYQPVCGSDEKTYGNSCEAECAGVDVRYIGACSETSEIARPPAPLAASTSVAPSTPDAPPDVPLLQEATSPNVPKTVDGARAPPRPPFSTCFDCPMDYQPVCGADNRNYPSKCIADCLGVNVKKLAKCNHCNNEECIIGKRNDLCILAAPTSKQCWHAKFECKPAADVRFGNLLGKCQQRPAIPPPSSPPRKAVGAI